ncbi:hypothetical protein F5880DRAFT_1611657 [Lentinula raphanica]|nr:hypothetical protein F5880DRAFT_1611657 [Lentinula raphanica]
MSTLSRKPTTTIASNVLYSALRRAFYAFSFGGAIRENDFVRTCRCVSTFLDHTEFQDHIESVQEMFVNVAEAAVITFITRIFPLVRLSMLYSADYIPESCEAISSLFDTLDEQVTKCCGYGLQLRMAAIEQLLKSDETIVATLPKTLNLRLFAEKCRSAFFTNSTLPPSSDQLVPNQNANDNDSLTKSIIKPDEQESNERQHTSSPTSSRSTPQHSAEPRPVVMDKTIETPRLTPEANDQEQSIRAAAERELALCAAILNNSQPAMQFDILQASSKIDLPIPKKTPSPVFQTFSVDKNSFSMNSGNLVPPDKHSPLDALTRDASRSPSLQMAANSRVSSPPLQVHDHSQQSSIDLALVPTELLDPYVSLTQADSSLRQPLSCIDSSAKLNQDSTSTKSSSDSDPTMMALEPTTAVKLSEAETEDLFGYCAASSPPQSVQEDDNVKTNDVMDAKSLQSSPTSRGRSVSCSSQMTDGNTVLNTTKVSANPVLEVKTPTKANSKRKRQPSIVVIAKESQRENRRRTISTTKVEAQSPCSESTSGYLLRSKRRRTMTTPNQGQAQKRSGPDITALALPGAVGETLIASPRRISMSVSNGDKENAG